MLKIKKRWQSLKRDLRKKNWCFKRNMKRKLKSSKQQILLKKKDKSLLKNWTKNKRKKKKSERSKRSFSKSLKTWKKKSFKVQSKWKKPCNKKCSFSKRSQKLKKEEENNLPFNKSCSKKKKRRSIFKRNTHLSKKNLLERKENITKFGPNTSKLYLRNKKSKMKSTENERILWTEFESWPKKSDWSTLWLIISSQQQNTWKLNELPSGEMT